MKKYVVKTLCSKDDTRLIVKEYGTKEQAFEEFDSDVEFGACYSLLTEETETDCFVLDVFSLFG